MRRVNQSYACFVCVLISFALFFCFFLCLILVCLPPKWFWSENTYSHNNKRLHNWPILREKKKLSFNRFITGASVCLFDFFFSSLAFTNSGLFIMVAVYIGNDADARFSFEFHSHALTVRSHWYLFLSVSIFVLVQLSLMYVGFGSGRIFHIKTVHTFSCSLSLSLHCRWWNSNPSHWFGFHWFELNFVKTHTELD